KTENQDAVLACFKLPMLRGKTTELIHTFV
ncbi:MAG: hypothetical protein RIS14_1030, partial [Pseudomonadota bacterium]